MIDCLVVFGSIILFFGLTRLFLTSFDRQFSKSGMVMAVLGAIMLVAAQLQLEELIKPVDFAHGE